jgi:hypothetical protein
VEFTLCSADTDIRVAGSTGKKRCERVLDVACIPGILAFYFARNERIFG